MLKIIPTPIDKEILYTISGSWWENELGNFTGGIYFEYFENEIIQFRFFYALGKIAILKGPFSSECTKEQLEALFQCQVSLDDLWEWIDGVPFKIIKCLDINDPSVRGVWKMENFYGLNHPNPLLKNYHEFQVSTATIRSTPYSCWLRTLKYEVLNEKDNLYWITLCLLKYQRQLSQQSEE